jgi:hypothetical protein
MYSSDIDLIKFIRTLSSPTKYIFIYSTALTIFRKSTHFCDFLLGWLSLGHPCCSQLWFSAHHLIGWNSHWAILSLWITVKYCRDIFLSGYHLSIYDMHLLASIKNNTHNINFVSYNFWMADIYMPVLKMLKY